MRLLNSIVGIVLLSLCPIGDAVLPRSVPSDSVADRNGIIEHYFTEGFQYLEIKGLIAALHGVILSVRQIKRILQAKGLKRRVTVTDSRLTDAILAIQDELNGGGADIGYRQMHRRLTRQNIPVTRDIVRRVLLHLDPEGVSRRRGRRLRRRKYYARGPNYIWHIDGNDKLKPFGFSIHGCIDGYSRKLMWLEVCTTNKDPAVVARFLTKCIGNVDGSAFRLRFDNGTENGLMSDVQTMVTNGVGFSTFGRSTANQRIEAYWSILKKNCLHVWTNLFRDMIDNGTFNNGDPVHIEAVRYFFGPILKAQLLKIKNEWNAHRIRPQLHSDCPSGCPDVLYYTPGNNIADFKVACDTDMLEDAEEFLTEHDSLYSQDIANLVKVVMDDECRTTVIEDARDMFESFMDKLEDFI